MSSEKEEIEEYSFKSYFVPFTTTKVILFIIIIGFVVFGNMLLNDFIADDRPYIINNPYIRNFDISYWFGSNIFNIQGQYRPISVMFFSILYSVYGEVPFLYHFTQLSLHIISTILLFLLFRRFFPIGVSFCLGLLFLVHPMQVESVSYIAQTVNQLFFISGMIPLLLLTKNTKINLWILVLSLVLLLVCILTKETGVLFLILIIVYKTVFDRKSIFKLLIGVSIILTIYLLLRFYIGHVDFSTRELAPIADLSLTERILNIPAVAFYYLKTFFYPSALAVMQNWIITIINLTNFYIPLIVSLGFISLLLSGIYLLANLKKEKQQYIFFLSWFLFGFMFHLQIFPLDLTVSDRWFYFTIAGLLGLLGLLYMRLAEKFRLNPWVCTIIFVIIFALLATRTIIRNSDWQNGITLYTKDINVNDNYQIENSLGVEYGSQRKFKKALEHYQRSVSFRPHEINLTNLAITYANLGNFQMAQVYFEKALHSKQYDALDKEHRGLKLYIGYASVLVIQNDMKYAEKFIEKGLKEYPKSAELWLLLALTRYDNYNKDAAMAAALQAYKLNSNNINVYQSIENNNPVIIELYDKSISFDPL